MATSFKNFLRGLILDVGRDLENRPEKPLQISPEMFIFLAGIDSNKLIYI
jgi:hypothetical protein